jgi:ribosome-binding factor A
MRRDENDGDHGGHRHARLQDLIRDELGALLRDDVTDPALADVRLKAVVLSVDYRHARVHFVLGGAPGGVESARLSAERALGRATSFFRARLAEAIDFKRVPDLRFVFDGVEPSRGPGGDQGRGRS